ncbi:hypothetical protein Q2T41_10390 [Maribacter confluentis]|uniref:GLPGLI family protein n=1 Tax=Maribacter confluentis TaxID=1656093 RepID=A0ABT8RQ65_9FLAO|nr:hypothetical protein [Maribacter confluentis]MDO1513064.1 hypothetical protein [Maribacter confluentis]
MGGLFLSRLKYLGVILLLSNWALAQNSYYVYKKSGRPYFTQSMPVKRGLVFKDLDTLTLQKLDTVYLINQLGELYELNKANIYTHNTLQHYKKHEKESSFTIKYFSYVWRQFMNQQENRQRPGVVYREERNIQLISPMDSIKWSVPKIEFTWKNRTDSLTTYFHLQEIETAHITKIGVNANSLMLFRDNLILNPGKSYKWAVTTTAFPDYKNVRFHNFELLTKADYRALEEEMKALTIALQLLGFSEKDIKEAICVDYKFCQQ